MLGEGAYWSDDENCLYWVDIKGQLLHRLDPVTGGHQFWPQPEPICWVTQTATGKMLAGFAGGLYWLEPEKGIRQPLLSLTHEPAHNRLNDAKTDRHGRLWFGSMDNQEAQPTGSLYRLRQAQALLMDSGYVVSNGPAFSPDGRYLYHASSTERRVYRFTLTEDCELSGKQVFTQFNEEMGYPDGMTVDVEGGLWVAQWGGGGICRFHPDGRLDRRIPLPAPQVTSLAFGGENLDRLFVTTAHIGMNEQQKVQHPNAGCLFELQVGVKGLAASHLEE